MDSQFAKKSIGSSQSLSFNDIGFIFLSGAFLLFSIYLRWNNHRKSVSEDDKNSAAVKSTTPEGETKSKNNNSTGKNENLKQRRKRGSNKK